MTPVRFCADENFNNDILRGLLRKKPELDIVRVQDVGLLGADDPTILNWTAQEERVLLTHDIATITRFAYERIQASKPMPGVLEVNKAIPVGSAIEGIILMIEASFEGEWGERVRHLTA